MIMAATWPGCSAITPSSAARSLYGMAWVSERVRSGTPRYMLVLPMYQSCQPW